VKTLACAARWLVRRHWNGNAIAGCDVHLPELVAGISGLGGDEKPQQAAPPRSWMSARTMC
jgi:hypothetical protein